VSVPAFLVGPALTGDVVVGGTVTVNMAQTGADTVDYEWSNGVDTGSTGALTLAQSDIGTMLTCTVTLTDAGGQTQVTTPSWGPIQSGVSGPIDVGRSITDALRSLKRYVAAALGDAWEVRLSAEQGAFERPYARVRQVASATYILTGGRFLADVNQPFEIIAYPLRGDDPEDAILRAQTVEDALFRTFRVGAENGRPLRVPLYNYDGVPLNQPGMWVPRGFMRVADLSTQPFVDPDDNKLYSVVCDVRLSWRRLAEPTSTGPPMTGLRQSWQG
jgi:hypothetical protein